MVVGQARAFVTDAELADLEAQVAEDGAASRRVHFPAGLPDEVRSAAHASSPQAAWGRSSEATERQVAKAVQENGERPPQRQSAVAQNLFAESFSPWQKTRLMYRSGKMSLAMKVAVKDKKQDKEQTTRQMIRAVFDELDSA
jgi:hypothetical protein